MSNLLSKNFHLDELTRSQTASRHGISNQPKQQHKINLRLLCINILQPVRNHYNQPVIVTSGYRCEELNRRIGGSNTSQHCKGEAADFTVPGISNFEVAKWISLYLIYDQLILEYCSESNPYSGWIHCSFSNHNRSQSLIFDGRKYYNFSPTL